MRNRPIQRGVEARASWPIAITGRRRCGPIAGDSRSSPRRRGVVKSVVGPDQGPQAEKAKEGRRPGAKLVTTLIARFGSSGPWRR